MSVKSLIISEVKKRPALKRLLSVFKGNAYKYPNGHYYSPVVSIEEVRKRENLVWAEAQDHIAGIDLNTEEQIELARQISVFYDEIPFTSDRQDKLRYYYENPFYSYTDGITLYGMMRFFKPKRIIEVGSGFSSSVMLDVNEIFFNNDIKFTFIDPYPQRLLSLMSEADKKNSEVLVSPIQLVDLARFQELEAGDVLFIDSSHVSKTDSDVNHLFFNILPLLKTGVIIHVHDIFFPFEYPKDWVINGRSWNEAYLLKAFLMYNQMFKIRFFSHYLHSRHKAAFEKMPLTYKNFGGNIWIQKL